MPDILLIFMLESESFGILSLASRISMPRTLPFLSRSSIVRSSIFWFFPNLPLASSMYTASASWSYVMFILSSIGL